MTAAKDRAIEALRLGIEATKKRWIVRDIDRGLGRFYLAPEGTAKDAPLVDFWMPRSWLLPRLGDVVPGDVVRIRKPGFSKS